MEKDWLNNVILNFFKSNVDIFGYKSTYQSFEEKTKENEDQTPKDGFNSDLLYGRVIYVDEYGKTHKSKPIAIKLTPNLQLVKLISFAFINEANFYTKVIPALNSLDKSFSTFFPKFHYCEMTFNAQKDQMLIIFEDLTARGFRMTDKKSFVDINHLMLMMRKIGQFHAFSYKAKNTIPDLFYPLANNFLETNFLVNGQRRNFIKRIAKRGVQRLQEYTAYEEYINNISIMLENADDICIKTLVGDKKNPLSVICHGDYFRSNIMFRYENNIPQDLVLIDLAMCRLASPALDLICVLYLHADQKTRDKYWDALIDEYYKALKETFPDNKVPQKSEILLEFVGRSFYAYLVASYFLIRLIYEDYGTTSFPLSDDICVKFRNLQLNELSEEDKMKCYLFLGGDLATQALSDILRDMIDRGFICK